MVRAGADREGGCWPEGTFAIRSPLRHCSCGMQPSDQGFELRRTFRPGWAGRVAGVVTGKRGSRRSPRAEATEVANVSYGVMRNTLLNVALLPVAFTDWIRKLYGVPRFTLPVVKVLVADVPSWVKFEQFVGPEHD